MLGYEVTLLSDCARLRSNAVKAIVLVQSLSSVTS